jgi:hypothetical protein
VTEHFDADLDGKRHSAHRHTFDNGVMQLLTHPRRQPLPRWHWQESF